MKDSNKILFKGAVMNCGIATAIINGIICFFTLTKANALLSSDLAFNFLSTAIGCGVICPFFGGLILKGVAAKNEIDFGSKSEQTIAKFIPNNIVLDRHYRAVFRLSGKHRRIFRHEARSLC